MLNTTESLKLTVVNLKKTRRAGGAGGNVVVGTGDDAAVVDVTDRAGVATTVQTIDFFRAFIDDPYVFGRIAAVRPFLARGPQPGALFFDEVHGVR